MERWCAVLDDTSPATTSATFASCWPALFQRGRVNAIMSLSNACTSTFSERGYRSHSHAAKQKQKGETRLSTDDAEPRHTGQVTPHCWEHDRVQHADAHRAPIAGAWPSSQACRAHTDTATQMCTKQSLRDHFPQECCALTMQSPVIRATSTFGWTSASRGNYFQPVDPSAAQVLRTL